jgi:hypothetical protein
MTDAHPLPEDLLEELLDDYLCWREQCAALHAAYQRWAHASRADRPAAFAAYVAQLEQEDHAARRYRTSARNATVRLTHQPLAPAA